MPVLVISDILISEITIQIHYNHFIDLISEIIKARSSTEIKSTAVLYTYTVNWFCVYLHLRLVS